MAWRASAVVAVPQLARKMLEAQSCKQHSQISEHTSRRRFLRRLWRACCLQAIQPDATLKAADRHFSQFSEKWKFIPHGELGGGTQHNLSTEFLGQALQSRRKVHGFSDHGILQTIPRSDIPAGQLSGMNPNADFDVGEFSVI